jgi:hypothetical protein
LVWFVVERVYKDNGKGNLWITSIKVKEENGKTKKKEKRQRMAVFILLTKDGRSSFTYNKRLDARPFTDSPYHMRNAHFSLRYAKRFVYLRPNSVKLRTVGGIYKATCDTIL